MKNYYNKREMYNVNNLTQYYMLKEDVEEVLKKNNTFMDSYDNNTKILKVFELNKYINKLTVVKNRAFKNNNRDIVNNCEELIKKIKVQIKALNKRD
jgi:archaellum component FlaC